MRKGFLIIALLAPFAAACGVAPRPVLSPERPAFASAVPRAAVPAAVELTAVELTAVELTAVELTAVELAPLAARPFSGLLELGDLALQPANTLVTFNCASVVGVAPMSVALPLTADASARITGCGFGGSQGTVEICNASSYGGTCVAATVTSWAATDITATINEGSFADETAVWLYVTTAGSVVNRYGLGPLLLQVSGECSLADGHDHAAMAAIGCFPDEDNTGVPSGTSLVAYTGPATITTNGTTIDAKIFEGADCPLNIQATGVLITNSQFNCTGQAIYIDDAAEYTEASNGTVFLVTIKDSYISCGDVAGSHGISEAYARMIRVHLELCENGADVNQKINWEDSFIHNLSDAGGAEEHADGAQHGCAHWEGGGGSSTCASGYVRGVRNVNYLHNTILGRMNNDADNSTSAIIMNKDLDVDHDVTVRYNLLGGGSYTIYCNQNVTGVNIQVIDNWFWTDYPPNPAGGRSTDCSDEADISGNKLFPSGTPITLN